MTVFAELLTLAKKVTLHLVNANTWDTTTSHKWTVPAGKRWFVFGGQSYRDVSATISVRAYSAADAHILSLLEGAAATTVNSWPSSGLNTWGGLLPLDVGEYVVFTFGVAQSTAAWLSGWAMEVDV